MKIIGSFILLVSLSIVILCGTIAAEDMMNDAKAENSTEAAAAQSAISPTLILMGFSSLVIGAMIVINEYR
ncbi:hypothetical protein FXV91_18120 [Methanosarcina sp. DH2]|uniref:hypothetical protein n=1 Tax=Methanosarcina sp. DH2 TaxID=2605639 RepID=UPI001E4EC9CE|nr:hypothetical protein [Methanosarcina sp. DH2]MCC4772008.1 hypothetical protein [Methanosarcina sp. DH2]